MRSSQNFHYEIIYSRSVQHFLSLEINRTRWNFFRVNPVFECDCEILGGRAKLKKYLFLMPMASLGKKKFL